MDLLERMQKLKTQEEISPEEVKKIPKKIEIKESLPERLDESLTKSKKLKIGSADLDLLSKSLDKTTGFDISNVNISQDDLWLLYRLKFGKSTRVKRKILLPQFTEAFTRNLAKMKKWFEFNDFLESLMRIEEKWSKK